MSEQLLKNITELLNQEKWTRAALASYTINNFKELDEIISQTIEAGVREEVIKLCDEHLGHTKNSIIALYLSGVFNLGKNLVDDSHLVILINIFTDNHKWNIVEYLCNRILDFGENKSALRILAECHVHKNEEEQKFKIWERLIRVDYEEAEIVKALAEKKETEGNKEGAIEYYKKALYRFINKKLYANVKDIWVKLIELSGDDLYFFFSVDKKIEKMLSDEKAFTLLELLAPRFQEKKEWDAAIEIYKRMLAYNPKEYKIRKDLISCFREKYTDNTHVDEYIRVSNLNQSWRNVYEAIADFEKHISFEKGNFVSHRSWGIGKIVEFKDDVFIIDFDRKKNHKMSLKMAVSALDPLCQDHIRVLKSTLSKEELTDKLEKDIAWSLKTIIKSFGNSANMKLIKNELVPSVFSAGKWTRWSGEARKILKTDPIFGTDPEKPDQYILRDKHISFEEKTYNKFKAEKNFFDRIKIVHEFLDHADPDSDFFNDMFSYFSTFLKSFSTVTEQVLSSYLFVMSILKRFPFLNPGIQISFSDLIARIEDISSIFNKIDDPDLKKEFLLQIKLNSPDWPKLYGVLFRHHLSRFIIDELVSNGKQQDLNQIFETVLSHYREYREAFVWLVRNFFTDEWYRKLNITYEKILICMVHLLDITFREIDNRREVSLNRKINKQIHQFLFTENRIEKFLDEADEDSITRIYTLIDDVKDLDPSIKIHLKQKIKDRFPSFHFLGEHEMEKVKRGLLVTRHGYEEKQKSLKQVVEVEIPDNSKEIGTAMKKGDLRENAEYKAALERQELLKTTASRLQDELQHAQIFDENDVDTSSVGFGTKVKLSNLMNNSHEEYSIFGPWESDPANNVISYLSPLGTALCNHRVDEELNFTINEKEYRYKILNIQKV
ncbi:MAG: transcription elongation factor GreA [Spirochaetaceae bacterium]|nr:MAG: transcription elongation factor GreA [Spirochaetaceae bacterium]